MQEPLKKQAHQVSPEHHPSSGADLATESAGLGHIKLQQMQDEFLKWLDATEHDHPDVDAYAYKKVR